MKCHQVLTGACNVGDKTFGVGSVEGVTFAAYAAGCNIIILAKNFERVQIIPGICHNNIQIGCVDVSHDSGKIATAYENKVKIFEPTPLLTRDSSHGLDYWWVQTGELDLECPVASLAWNHEGTRLLTAGNILQMWRFTEQSDVKFDIGDAADSVANQWVCTWRVRPASPVAYLAYSADGTLFATAGRCDRLVRIWYQNQQLLLPTMEPDIAAKNNITYSFIYVAHPRPVTGFSWRATSRYMPRGAVANMLVTSCVDNICRLWAETVLPDDGLVSMQQLDPAASQDPYFRAHRQKQRFIQRLKHMRQSFTARKLTLRQGDVSSQTPIPTLPSTYSIHDFHNFGFQGSGIAPGLHFHLAATINALTDIPLVPAMNVSTEAGGNPHKFVLHWMNNKEIYFSMEGEQILAELAKLALQREDSSVERELAEETRDRESPSNKSLKLTENKYESSPIKHVMSRNDIGNDGSIGLSSAASMASITTDISHPGSGATASQLSLSEALDRRIEALLREWHHSSDLLFSVHPVDGSLMVWVADFLDEYQPGAFRQAQVSFSSRIPNAIPLGDASTMSSNVTVFNSTHILNVNQLIKEREAEEAAAASAADEENENPDHSISIPNLSIPYYKKYHASPIVSMISKHNNGTLNLWDVTFSPDTKFCQLLNISHKARANGHRFRVNDITSHPVLPLILTTSHHNMAAPPSGPQNDDAFCSELILWRVDSIGSISRPGSGGISELARINSRQTSAFSDVAWIPTLLPSSVLGSISNSPSACFVSSDGHSLRVYQAVIDARALLAEINNCNRREDPMYQSTASMSSDAAAAPGSPVASGVSWPGLAASLVSAQSSARPGAVIELDQIEEAQQDWQKTMLLHAFQEEMVIGPGHGMQHDSAKLGLIPPGMSAMVDLREQGAGFKETFFVVVAEAGLDGVCLMHMWELGLASTGEAEQVDKSNQTSRSATPEADEEGNIKTEVGGSRVVVTTRKVCSQSLPLPADVTVIHCVPAAGHLSSSSIYPACLAPYLLVTACSDNVVRFWTAVDASEGRRERFVWEEWSMESESGSSAIDVPGMPLSVSAAYSGRIAVAYRAGSTFQKRGKHQDPAARFVNLHVAIYEWESTGGSEWILEDRIVLKNVEVSKILPDIDQSVLHQQTNADKNAKIDRITKNLYDKQATGEKENFDWKLSSSSLVKVPSRATMSKLKEGLDHSCSDNIVQKQLVQLDWVSNEDGSYILTIAVANKVLQLTTVSSEIAAASKQAANEVKKDAPAKRSLLRRSSSIGLQQVVDEIRWMIIRKIELRTADGLPPLPMSVSWARDGVLMCAMDNEVAVYSQWRDGDVVETRGEGEVAEVDIRVLHDEDLLAMAQESQLKNIGSAGGLMTAGSNMKQLCQGEEKAREMMGERMSDAAMLPDVGLFEMSHMACPVLPQYHPKQLMELLNSGKIRWVKAILSHLVKCIAPERLRTRSGSVGEEEKSPRDWSRSRQISLSVSPSGENKRSSTSAMPEDSGVEYAEIKAIPPLPLWTLLAADKECGAKDQTQEYTDLFNLGEQTDEVDSLDIILEEDVMTKRERRLSLAAEQKGLSYFGPRQARILSKLLTHTQLPGLTSLDQMHLLALADTVASCNLDLAERFAIDAAKSALSKETLSGTGAVGEPSPESLDDCGLRFLLAMKHYNYLKRCLPMSQRSLMSKQGMNSSHLIWAFHSESEEDLTTMIPSIAKGNPTLNEIRELGIVWWVRSNNLLKKLVEKLAKAAFQKNQDPLDAAIFYFAMRKKALVWGLYRSIKDVKMTQFFANNFTEDRWIKAAQKNAFALMGKQRFLHAAAFFLLSGSLKDTLEILIQRVGNIQLALLVARLYEGGNNASPPSVREILNTHILGVDEDGKGDVSKAHPDPFLRSMAYWTMSDYESSLSTLVQKNVGHDHPSFSGDENLVLSKKQVEADPEVFNFYVYLRTHPLIIRHKVASKAQDKSKAIMLSGFKSNSVDKASTSFEDAVTPLERRLFFTTAHFHIRSGCPALALEVLNKLPAKQADESSPSLEKQASVNPEEVETGRLNDEAVDWSTLGRTSPERPKSRKSEDGGMDWGSTTLDMDTSNDDDLKLEWSDNDDDDDDIEDHTELQREKSKEVEDADLSGTSSNTTIDIMAQQLKFTACLKIMMEELSTLATGFEMDGGILRYQLYIWLEKEVDALRELCNYGSELGPDITATNRVSVTDPDAGPAERRPTLHQVILNEKMDFDARLARASKRKKWLLANQTLLRTLLSYCNLHGANGGGLASVRMELILLLQELQQEKTTQQLLSPLPFPTTLPLLSACIAQQKTVVVDPVHYLQTISHDMLYQLCSQPAPLPSTANYANIFLLRDLSVALSSCIYQSMCDSDTINVRRMVKFENTAGLPGEALNRLHVMLQDSHLMFTPGNGRRASEIYEGSEIITEPAKWPGVTALRALLDRDKDEDIPNLNILLCETYVAVYLSLLVYALSICDCHILYRLVAQHPSSTNWAQIYGGGSKKQVKVETAPSPQVPGVKSGDKPSPQTPNVKIGDKPPQDLGLDPAFEAVDGENILSSGISTVTNITKQRIKLNMKLLGVQLGSSPNDQAATWIQQHGIEKPSSREQFVAPEMSVVSQLMAKPALDTSLNGIDYDSGTESDPGVGEESYDDEDDDPFSVIVPKAENVEHSDPDSYAWGIIRLAVLNLAQKNIESFLAVAGIEISELPIASSLIYKCLRSSESWGDTITTRLGRDGKPPDNFIPGCFADTTATGPIMNKYAALLEVQNTPFRTMGPGLGPIKRLWRYLVHQESVQSIFIRYIFGRSGRHARPGGDSATMADDSEGRSVIGGDSAMDHSTASNQRVRVIQKEQDSITAFCINKVSSGLMSVATPREILEVNMGLLLHPNAWSDRMDDEAEFDILYMQEENQTPIKRSASPAPPSSDSHLHSAWSTTGSQSGMASLVSSPMSSQAPPFGTTGSQPRSSHVVKRHKMDGVRRLAAHSHLPLYVSGGQDGAVAIWEWTHSQPITTVRPPGIYAKVNRIVFSPQGNKFGVCDGDGNLALWQAANTSHPYFNLQCHSKNTADFIFQGGSSSLLATAGHSHDNKNIALWDTLMPSKRSCTQGFTCHEAGAACLVHATQHQLIISAGKKGQVCIWDLRQNKLIYSFKAHDHAVKCLAIDENETMFVTGAVDGTVKVWDLSHHKCLHTFAGEHARQGLFKNISQGVAQVHLDNNMLFSCGADGSCKVRQLPERDLIVNSAY